MPEPAGESVLRECRSLTRYLTGREPSDAVIRAYARGLSSGSFRSGPPATPLDETLLRIASLGSGLAGLADAWARLFAPGGRLRRRLVLLLAVLESHAPDCEAFEEPAGGLAGAIASSALSGVGFAVRVVAALPLVLLLHVPTTMQARLSRRASTAAAEDDS